MRNGSFIDSLEIGDEILRGLDELVGSFDKGSSYKPDIGNTCVLRTSSLIQMSTFSYPFDFLVGSK